MQSEANPPAACEGRAGAVLRAVSAAEGKTLSELRLDTPPVWDGMAVATGKAYLPLENGAIVCLGKRSP